MPHPDFPAGSTVTAGKLNALRWSSVSQVSDSAAVNNSTVLVNTAVTFVAVANATYRFELNAKYDSSEAADIDFAWTGPAGASASRFLHGIGFSSTGAPNDATRSASWHIGALGTRSAAGSPILTQFGAYFEKGELTTAGTAGSFTLQFAQRVAVAVNTVFKAESKLWYIRVE